MRNFSSLASRASPSLQNLTQNLTNQSNNTFQHNISIPNSINANPIQPNKVINQGKSPSNSQINNFNNFNSTSNYLPKHKLAQKSIDHNTLNQILLRKDWYLLLNHELKAGRVILNPQSVVSILQNLENPIHIVRFYIWVLNINELFEKNQRIKGVFSNALYRKGPVLLNAELVQDVRNAGFRVTEDFMCILIGSWGKLGLAKYCVEIFGQISLLGINPSTRLYNAVIDALIKSNSLNLAYLKFQQMSADCCRPDRFTYNILIHGVCKSGVVDEALRLVKMMERAGYAPNVFTYTILIDGYCNGNRVDDAFRLLETMRARKVNPSDATYRSLVHGVFRCVKSDKAFELLSGFVEKESVLPKIVCDTMLYCLSNKSMAMEAASFLRCCRKRGYVPDSGLFNIIVTCLINKVDVKTACGIVDSFLQLGLTLSLDTYLTLIETLFRGGYAEEGSRYLTQMFQAGLVLNVFSYNMLIDCLLKAKMTQEALDMYMQMQKGGISPNLATFNTLIDGHFKTAQTERARELLVMLLQHGFKPDIFTFSSVIDGLCRANKIDDAFDCFAEMKEWGVNPNTVTYNILIRYLSVIGDIGRSMVLFKKMKADGISPDKYSFNALIQSFCRRNKIEKALNLFRSMIALGLAPDNITFGALIKSLCDIGKFENAKEILFSMEANGYCLDSSSCDVLINMLLKLGKLKEAQDIARKYNKQASAAKHAANVPHFVDELVAIEETTAFRKWELNAMTQNIRTWYRHGDRRGLLEGIKSSGSELSDNSYEYMAIFCIVNLRSLSSWMSTLQTTLLHCFKK
ncbi:hypothetical protein KSS87_004933 [Heliosperma pusillum]|nr:hypothetical protein KSS87_004933 [Heliosperma pusillum]